MKKCPGCGSSRITQTSDGIKCQKCGYVNKKKYVVTEPDFKTDNDIL